MTPDHLDDQFGEALAGVADHLDRVTLAGEFDLWRLRVVAIDHGGDGLVIRARAWRLAMARTRDIS